MSKGGDQASIPLVDLRAVLARDRNALRMAFDQVLDEGTFVLGPAVERFETELALYMDIPHVVGVASGSDALELGLRALGVGAGDAVVTTAFSFVATAEAIVHAGATPLFADIRASDWLLDLNRLDAQLAQLPQDPSGGRCLPTGERVRALLPVHLFGAVVDADHLRDLCRRYQLWLIEDVAQALGGTSWETDGGTSRETSGSAKAGTFGDVGCLSFFPTKTLGALGDGGAIVTRHDNVAQRARMLRQHGGPRRGCPEFLGRNSRLDALQAACLSVRLRRLDEEIAERRHLLDRYAAALAPLAPALSLLSANRLPGHAGQTAVLRASRRDALAAFLGAQGIGTAIYYAATLPQYLPYAAAPRLGDLPEAERATRETLAVPLYPGMTDGQVTQVVDTLIAACSPSGPLA